MMPCYGRADDQVAGVARELVVLDLAAGLGAKRNHFADLSKMVGGVLPAVPTGPDRAVDGLLEVAPLGAAGGRAPQPIPS